MTCVWALERPSRGTGRIRGWGGHLRRGAHRREEIMVCWVRFQPFYLRIPSDMNRKFKVPETASEFSGEKNNKTQAHPPILS